jgi:hypothetical protein
VHHTKVFRTRNGEEKSLMSTVTTTRSGEHIVVKSALRSDVEAAVKELLVQGAVPVGVVGRLGNNWIATVRAPQKNVAKEWATVTNIGLQFVVECRSGRN